jgi:hypothetical protein
MASETQPGEAPKSTEPTIPYVRQIFCDLLNPSRGVIVSGSAFGKGNLEIMIDGNTVLVDRKMFSAAMSAYAP